MERRGLSEGTPFHPDGTEGRRCHSPAESGRSFAKILSRRLRCVLPPLCELPPGSLRGRRCGNRKELLIRAEASGLLDQDRLRGSQAAAP